MNPVRVTLSDPAPPDISGLTDKQAADRLGHWLLAVARQRGEAAVYRAIGPGWPGTPAQRAALSQGFVDAAINEARQVAHEPWARQAMALGRWGV